MDLFITSIKGKLVQNNKVLKNTKLFFPKEKYIKGDLTTPASIKNIHSISESILEIFIRPMGLFISNREMLEISQIDIGNKYINGECPPIRSKNNLTRGWSYLVAGVMHRFFHENFDLYKVLCPLDKNMRDKNENNPLLYLLQMTKTPFLDSSILNVMYSLNKGVNLKSKPNSFSFSTVIILQRNQGASEAGLILK